MEPLSTRTLNKFFAFMNSIDTSGKVKFTMSIANNDSVLEFLDLSLHINEHNKTCVPNHSVRNMSRSDARQVKPKSHRLNVNLVTVYNPIIKNLQNVIRNNLPILYSDPKIKNLFPEGSINVASMFPQAQVESHSMVSKCKSKRCDICQNYLVRKNEYTCTVTGKTYKVRGKLCCASSNVIYLINCKLCKEQCVGSAFKDNYKPKFRVHKSDVKTGKDRCGVAKHFLTKCTNGSKVENIEFQLTEQVQECNYDLEDKLWCREKYQQAQLFTVSHGMHSKWGWYSTNRKGYRKKK